MKTPEERMAWELQAYGGLTSADLKQEVENSLMRPSMYAMSILSDVQELIARSTTPEDRERARQWINRAKWVIDHYNKEKST